jgi:hypothetical protein
LIRTSSLAKECAWWNKVLSRLRTPKEKRGYLIEPKEQLKINLTQREIRKARRSSWMRYYQWNKYESSSGKTMKI